MERDCFAYLKRASIFYHIFRGGRVPIKSILPTKVNLEGSDETTAYMLDVERCSEEQIYDVASAIAKRSNCTAEVVLEQVRERGLPIRESQTELVSGGPNTIRALS